MPSERFVSHFFWLHHHATKQKVTKVEVKKRTRKKVKTHHEDSGKRDMKHGNNKLWHVVKFAIKLARNIVYSTTELNPVPEVNF